MPICLRFDAVGWCSADVGAAPCRSRFRPTPTEFCRPHDRGDGGCGADPAPGLSVRREPDPARPASICIGDIAYRVRSSAPVRLYHHPAYKTAGAAPINCSDGAVLESDFVYIVPLLESLALPPSIVAAANPKSSTGRLNVFTRVIADGTRRFDMIGAGYHGPLYARDQPKTLPACCCARAHGSHKCASALVMPSSTPTNSMRCATSGSVDIDDAGASRRWRGAVRRSLQQEANGFVGYRAERHTGVVDIDRRSGYAVNKSGSRSRPSRTAA